MIRASAQPCTILGQTSPCADDVGGGHQATAAWLPEGLAASVSCSTETLQGSARNKKASDMPSNSRVVGCTCEQAGGTKGVGG